MVHRARVGLSFATALAALAALVIVMPAASGSTADPYPSGSAVGSASASPQPGGGKCNRDLDCDAMPNRWERRYGLDPNRNDSRGDPDRDHLSNLLEYLNNGDPRNPDSDGDGLHDGREIHFFHTRVDYADAIVGRTTGLDQCPTGSTGAYACPVVTLFDATLVLRDVNGDEAARTESDYAGRFNFSRSEVGPGYYTLVPQPVEGFTSPESQTLQIFLRGGGAQRIPEAYSNDAGPGVAGQTTRSPTCGGPQRRDEGCIAVMPGAHIDVEDANGNVVASTTSGDDGRYVVSLQPGDYTVVARSPDGSFPTAPAPVHITVSASDSGPNHVDLDYSTGIL
ncbi:MAG: hypothetical protein QOF16_1464 [Actinomycetota bacterium]|nr:hypothetical protein [Actinomycetota bacterium]